VQSCVVELRLELPKARAQSVDDLRVEGKPVPVLALPKDPRASADKIKVSPATCENFPVPESRTFDEKERRELVGESGRTDPL